ncbi:MULTISPECIES: flippase [unclassified Endozoicomonas]|uniref:flippase n=1 Tax=unclassified Endozoicomonas TaxID=2644528 RepID=UPI003BB4955A
MVVKNTLWVISEKLFRLILSVFVSALVARHLKPEGFGVLSYYLAIIAVFTIIASLGFNRIIVREVAKDNSFLGKAEIISTAFILRFSASLLISLVCLVLSYFFVEQSALLSIIAFLCVLFNAFDVLDFYEQGVGSFRIVSVLRALAFFLSAISKVIMVYFGLSITSLFLGTLLEYFLIAVLFMRFCARENETSLISIDFFRVRKAKELLSESWPEIIAGFSSILFMKQGQLMLFYMTSESEVGIYSAALRISEAWYFVPVAIVATTFPKLVELREISNQGYIKAISYLFSVVIILSLAVSFFVTLFGGWLIDTVYGDLYSQSSTVLIIHVWASVFLSMGLVSGSWLVVEKKLKLNLYRNIFGLIVNFVSNMVLIPRFGASGAAISIVLSFLSAFLLFDFFVKELRCLGKEKLLSFRYIFDSRFWVYVKSELKF